MCHDPQNPDPAPSETAQRICVEFTDRAARDVRKMRWHPSQEIVKDTGQTVTASFLLDDTVEFKRWILSFGRHARILTPKSLADDICDEAHQITANYKSNTISNESPDCIVDFLVSLYALKRIKRRGWEQHSIAGGESVADHSYFVTLLSLVLADLFEPGLDRNKLLMMALIHDVVEIDTGDITPMDNIDSQTKYRNEKAAADSLFSKISGLQEYAAVWDSFEREDCKEAVFVKNVDKLEMALQALVYERTGDCVLDTFFESSRNGLTKKALKDLLDIVEQRRGE